MRKRDRLFVRALVQEATFSEDARVRAVCKADRCIAMMADEKRQRKRALRKADVLMNDPDVRRGLRNYIGAITGFTHGDAAGKLVEHIESGNWDALKFYFQMALPQPSKQVNVQAQHLHANVSTILSGDRGDSVPMTPRHIGPTMVLPSEEKPE